jgi:hypothetical protein
MLDPRHGNEHIPHGTAAAVKDREERVRRGQPVPGSGQALAEFAISFGLFMLVIGAIIQLGLLVWTINSIHEIARDTARWASTQPTAPCDSTGNRTTVASTADALARQYGLMGYRAGTWTNASVFSSMSSASVGVEWSGPTTFLTDCPPSDNQTAWFVKVRINHVVPIFLPGVQTVLGFVGILDKTCGNGFCISTTTEQRMEPKAP